MLPDSLSKLLLRDISAYSETDNGNAELLSVEGL